MTMIRDLTLSPPSLVYCRVLNGVIFTSASIFRSASMSHKVDENGVRVSNSLDPVEAPSYSASHPDPKLFAYETIVVTEWQAKG